MPRDGSVTLSDIQEERGLPPAGPCPRPPRICARALTPRIVRLKRG